MLQSQHLAQWRKSALASLDIASQYGPRCCGPRAEPVDVMRYLRSGALCDALAASMGKMLTLSYDASRSGACLAFISGGDIRPSAEGIQLSAQADVAMRLRRHDGYRVAAR